MEMKTTTPLEALNLTRYYLDSRGIMSRWGVSRATAYRYMAKAPDETKLRVRQLNGKPITYVMTVTIDRIHKNAKPGNPNMRKTP